MSVAHARVIVVKERGNKMTVININNVIIPLHWDDRYYIADCSECGVELAERTTDEMRKAIIDHCCVTP
jgi:hypothetical protein